MTLTTIQPPEVPSPHRFTRDEYYQMAELGFFDGRRVELIDGEIVDMSPQKDPHAVTIMLIGRVLQKALPTMLVRCQLPLTLPGSEPEPDFAVVTGEPRDYLGLGHHPKTALLVIEVADRTLAYDRKKKSKLYAAAGIQEYWIVNLVQRQLEIFRQPAAEGFASSQIIGHDGRVMPIVGVGIEIAVADLLP